jgi:hypothetical protein
MRVFFYWDAGNPTIEQKKEGNIAVLGNFNKYRPHRPKNA